MGEISTSSMYKCMLTPSHPAKQQEPKRFSDYIRVARWHIFKPKIPISVNLVGSCNLRCWHTLWPFGPFILRPFLYILRPFGVFYSYLVYFLCFGMIWIWKNLATLDYILKSTKHSDDQRPLNPQPLPTYIHTIQCTFKVN
jgi:hypothetical protein